MAGSDSLDNLVDLSAKEHFICHMLLTKMTSGKNQIKMLMAFKFMRASFKGNRYVSSSYYSLIKSKYSKIMSDNSKGNLNSQYGSKWVSNISSKTVKKIPSTDLDSYLKNGWIAKRITDFDLYNKPRPRFYPKTTLNRLQLYRMQHGLSPKLPLVISSKYSFVIMSPVTKKLGFDFLSVDLEKEYIRFKTDLYKEHIIDDVSFPAMSRKYNVVIHSIEVLFKIIDLPQKSKITNHRT